MLYVWHDAGRPEDHPMNDCAIRAVSAAAKRDYTAVLDAADMSDTETGVRREETENLVGMFLPGWEWFMFTGRIRDLPARGRFIARAAGHVCYISNGVLYDTVDTRERECVGYWRPMEQNL